MLSTNFDTNTDDSKYNSLHDDTSVKTDMNATKNTEQRFIYKNQNQSIVLDQQSLLMFGYIRMLEDVLNLQMIPVDVIQIILSFFGKKYQIEADPPKQSELDYAVEWLTPIEMIGVDYTLNKMLYVWSAFAKKCILPGSYIIQINGKDTSQKTSTKEMKGLMRKAKQYAPSCLVFRCNKILLQKGMHLQCDVRFEDADAKFPYREFTKAKIQSCFDNVFDNIFVVYEVYWNYDGVSILVFVQTLTKHAKNQLQTAITKNFKQKVSNNCIVNVKTILYGPRYKGLNVGFGTPFNWTEEPSFYPEALKQRSVSSLITLVKGIDDGKNAWYYVYVRPENLEQFRTALNDDEMIDFNQHGCIIESGYGNKPPQFVTDNIKSLYMYENELEKSTTNTY